MKYDPNLVARFFEGVLVGYCVFMLTASLFYAFRTLDHVQMPVACTAGSNP